MEIQTSTIDRLFLELSQFTRARTRRELMLEGGLREIIDSRLKPWVWPSDKAHIEWCIQKATAVLYLADGPDEPIPAGDQLDGRAQEESP